MTEEFRSILIGTAGLSVAGVIALLLTRARGGVDASPGKTVRDAAETQEPERKQRGRPGKRAAGSRRALCRRERPFLLLSCF